ncbi:GNAT family N-acetyltransferase [Saccharibacillus sp. VR-M41]|uniref:GNAT family N-acetyltransferase n=1 Tax=Saccharibacillus alkalitolerans TaxID=2705290 RepID=A0ABX0F6U3_9BACL|nr:GNAT family N-acetyltransferase [Saccharibacillus alkalitolerans]
MAPNVHSIAEAQFLPGFSSLAIYRGDTMIGYTLFGPDPDDHGMYWIHRLMIDARYQQAGAGFQAVLRVIEEIGERPDRSELVRLGYHPANEAARKLYAKVGFAEEGVAPWGEMIAAYAYSQR